MKSVFAKAIFFSACFLYFPSDSSVKRPNVNVLFVEDVPSSNTTFLLTVIFDFFVLFTTDAYFLLSCLPVNVIPSDESSSYETLNKTSVPAVSSGVFDIFFVNEPPFFTGFPESSSSKT